jgi:hypothetical protein
MKNLKLLDIIMMVSLEKIPNGLLMDLVLPLLLMLSISDYLDTIFIILKLMLTLLFLELLEFTILNLLLVPLLIVSALLMTKVITGIFVQLMVAQPVIGSVPSLKFLDYLAPLKVKKLLKKLSFNNLC